MILLQAIKRPSNAGEIRYAGQQQGNVVADVLFGDVNPSGKLPVSFPAAERQRPIATTEQYPGTPPEIYPGSGNLPQAFYTERLNVGYRGYDALGIAPLFAFGHGLSYTTFAYNKVKVTPLNEDGSAATNNSGATAAGACACAFM